MDAQTYEELESADKITTDCTWCGGVRLVGNRRGDGGGAPGAEGRLEVIATDPAVDVQHFPGNVKPLRDPAGHRTRINLSQRHAAGGPLIRRSTAPG